MKMSHSGETWVERSPFNQGGIFPYLEENKIKLSPSDEEVSEPSEVSEPTEEINEPVEEVNSDKPVKHAVTQNDDNEVRVITGTEPVEVKVQTAEVTGVSNITSTKEESPKIESKKTKLAKRRVVINTPQKEEKKEGEMDTFSQQQRRSQSVNYGSQSMNYGTKALRRKSLVMLRSGHTGEKGSRRFRAALKKDSIYEGHPGWESIRKLSMVVG